MSPAFISGCLEHLPEAAITFDKFHVIKEVANAMDELRKAERKSNDMLKGHRYTFLKNKLVPKLQCERDLLLEMYPKLGEGYRLMHLFKDFWDIKQKAEAESTKIKEKKHSKSSRTSLLLSRKCRRCLD